MTDRLFVDIHVIQTLPPSCVNRDDLGSPKTAFYGGVTRARVSSQAWKRAMRQMFREMGEDVGQRTKHILDMVTAEIKALAPDAEEPEELAKKVIQSIGLAFDAKKKNETKVLVFVSSAQARALAAVALAHKDEVEENKKKAAKEQSKAEKALAEVLKKEGLKALESQPSSDIALFGRMVAEATSLNFDAAAQVAHAISTHEVHNEFDYFTAVDDLKPEDTVGAGHLGTIEFNSSTMYRYATVNAMELARHLGKDVPHVICAFTEAFIRSMPTGKQNSFANQVRPDAVYVTIRKDQPVNMAGAFEKPVRAGKDGYVEGSIRGLISYAKDTYNDYYAAPELALVVGTGMDALGDKMPLSAMLDKLEKHLTEALAGKESE